MAINRRLHVSDAVLYIAVLNLFLTAVAVGAT